MLASAVMLIGNVTPSDRQKISTTELPIAKRVDSYTCFTSYKLFEFAHTYYNYGKMKNLSFQSCSTDADCKDTYNSLGVDAKLKGKYPLCFRRQAGVNTSVEEPSICCNKWALYENYTNVRVGTKAPKRPILAKKADGFLLNEFCSIPNSNDEICSTDKDCDLVADRYRSSHHYCLSREEGPSICCEKLAMLLPSVEKNQHQATPDSQACGLVYMLQEIHFRQKDDFSRFSILLNRCRLRECKNTWIVRWTKR